MANWVELRVHGVHGTSPGSMLGVADADVRQVAGDNLTGVYRPVEEAEPPLRTLRRAPDQPEHVVVEAYSWGALTSGVQGMLGWVRRVGWLLLLPFALANMAYWARMHVALGDRRDRWGVRAVRASGLLLTVFMILTPTVIAIDMLGWQCFREGVPRCSRLPGHLDFLAGWTAGQRLLTTSLVPLLVVLVLWALSRQTMGSYEVAGAPAGDRARGELPELILRRDGLWRSRERTTQLGHLHVAAALAAIVVVVSTHMLRVDKPTEETPWFWAVLVAIAAVVIAKCLVVVCFAQVGDLEPQGDATGPPAWWAPRLRDAALVLVVLQSVALWKHDGLLDQTKAFQGTDWWILSLFVALTALHLSVFFGARLRAVLAVPLVLGVAVGGIVMVVLYAHDRYLDFSRDEFGLAVAVSVVGFVLMAYWHYRIADPDPLPGALPDDPPTRDRVAWRGAGASVLLAAAAWIGLLFTSSAVTASADYLNGDQSVADLRTATHEKSPGTAQYYVASGNVVLRKPVITIEDGRIFIHAGNVVADRVLAKVEGDKIDHRIGTTARRTPIRLLVPPGSVLDIDRGCQVEQYVPGRGCKRNPTATYFGSDQVSVGEREVWLGTLVDCADPAAADPDDASVASGLCPTEKKGLVTLRPQERLQAPLVIPQVLAWMPIGQFVWLIAVALVLGWCLLRFKAWTGAAVASSLREDISPPDIAIPLTDRARCIGKRTAAALSHRAETLLDVVGSVTGLVALLLIVCTLTGQVPWDRGGMAWTNPLSTVALYLMLGTAGGLLLVGSYLRRSEGTRKAVGVIWDVTTFWPRAAHPLAPPCYAERVVPELETRARWVLESEDRTNGLILSGHSQGSLIVAAMASRLDDEDFARVRFITYGSQIRALYGRIFPRVFGPEAIGYDPTPRRTRLDDGWPDTGAGSGAARPPLPGSLRQRLEDGGGGGGSWVNLFRRSDPLGFRVFADLDGDPAGSASGTDLPVMEVPPADRGDPGPSVAGHSGYQHSPVYRRVVCTWAGEQQVESTYDPAGVLDLPPLPRG